MLHISKLIDNANEIKSRIGLKPIDVKVIEYYNLLTEGLNSYPKSEQINSIISMEIDYWESLIERDKLNEVDKKRFKKIGLPVNIDITELQNQIVDILHSTKSSIEKEQDLVKIETISFARALFFYLSNLWFIKNHKSTNGWKVVDLKSSVINIPENLNFIINYIKEIGRLNCDEMCVRYSKIVNNVKKTEYIKLEIEEHSKILKSHISSNDWKYLDEHFGWSIIGLRPNGFNIDDIRNIHGLLKGGDFYSAILKYEIGVELTTLLLTTEMYIEFLQSQTLNNTSIENNSTIKSNNSFVIDYEITIDMDKESVKNRRQKFNEEFLNMLGQLKGKGFISEEATPSMLNGLIGKDDVKNKVKWMRSIGSLHYFVSQIANNLNTQHSIWQSAINCFTDKNGKSYTIEQLRDNPSEKDYAKYQSSIESITSIFTKAHNNSRKSKI